MNPDSRPSRQNEERSIDTHVPTISVGMPVYNGERSLASAAESILQQTCFDLELIISDNASTDGTQAVARQIASLDSRVRYFKNAKNVGVAQNYNRALGLARGRYFKWASANDRCEPTMLEKCLQALESRPDAVLCYPLTSLVFEGGQMEHYEETLELEDDSPCQRFKELMEGLRLNNMLNGVIRTEVLRKTILHGSYLSSDIPLMADLVLRGKFIKLPEYLFYRSMDRDSATKHKAFREVERYFVPEARGHLRFQNWKRQGGFLAGAWRVPMSLRQKVCVYRYLVRQLYWSRRSLVGDVTAALRGRKP